MMYAVVKFNSDIDAVNSWRVEELKLASGHWVVFNKDWDSGYVPPGTPDRVFVPGLWWDAEIIAGYLSETFQQGPQPAYVVEED